MLVLSRKIGQRIVVPQSDLRIVVLSVRGRQVRLGIEAPPDVAVLREEVWLRDTVHASSSSDEASNQEVEYRCCTP